MISRNLSAVFITIALGCLPLTFGSVPSYSQTKSIGPLSASSPNPVVSPKLVSNYGKMPLRFEANRGQADSRVQFVSRGQGYTLFLTSNEAVLTLGTSAAKQSPSNSPLNAISERPQPNQNTAVVRLQLVGANHAPVIKNEDDLPSKSNYFIGNDPSRWHTNIPNYGRVRYHDIYPGIDLVYYGNQRQLEHDFVVSPGADPSLIALAVRGADRLRLDSAGNLLLMTQGGVLHLEKPAIYQIADGNRQTITGRFRLSGKNTVGFTVVKYNHHLPLIIDPVLSYSTYLGGSGDDYANSITVDATGNAYVGGSTTSVDFPTSAAFQTKIGGGTSDAFVTKIGPDGSLIWSTYLGGSGADQIDTSDTAMDSGGNVYVAGQTVSLDFPISANALQKSYTGGGNFNGAGDGFVAKLSPDGSSLLYSTYLGGNYDDWVEGIAVDGNGYAYVSGATFSTNFPVKNAYQSTLGGGQDAFVAELAPDGSALVFSTYFGGWNGDLARSIARASDGRIYVTGQTAVNNNFPTLNALQAAPGGGTWKGFVAGFSSDGVLLFSTYLGGAGDEDVRETVVDSSGDVYVAGTTTSSNFPMMHPFQGTFTGSSDGFVTKISHDGSSIIYSTLLGGSKENAIYGVGVDGSGNMYVGGYTSSVDFPIQDAFQSSYAGGAYDAFVASLTADGTALRYSSYLGGTGDDYTHAIAVDAQGNAYVAGYTNSTDFPTANPFQQSFGKGTEDAFVAKIGSGSATPILSATPTALTFTATEGESAPSAQLISIGNTGGGSLTWTASTANSWLFLDSNSGTAPSTVQVSVDIGGLTAGTYHDTITVTSNGASGSPATIAVTLTVTANPILSLDTLSLAFSATVGGSNPAAQAVIIANPGSGTLAWAAAKTQPWLSLDSSSGTAPSTIHVSVNIANLATGTYQDTITIAATGASSSPQAIAVTLTVSPAPDFKIDTASGGNYSSTVTAGSTASYKLEAAPLNGFTGAVSFTCSGLPSKTTCSASPAPANVTNTAPVPFTVAIATTATTTSAAGIFTGFGSSRLGILAATIILLVNLWLLAILSRRWRQLMLLALLVCAFGITSCGGGGGGSTSTPTTIPGTPAGSYTVVLTSTSGNITHTTNLTLTVQ